MDTPISKGQCGGTAQIGGDVDRDRQKPEHERRLVPGRPLLAIAKPKEPQLNSRGEEHNGEDDQGRSQPAQDGRRRARLAISHGAAVVADEPIAHAAKFEQQRGNQEEADHRVSKESRPNSRDHFGAKRYQQDH